jgi:hypothetical protein
MGRGHKEVTACELHRGLSVGSEPHWMREGGGRQEECLRMVNVILASTSGFHHLNISLPILFLT